MAILALSTRSSNVAKTVQLQCLLMGLDCDVYHEPGESWAFDVIGRQDKCEYVAARSGATIVDYQTQVPVE